MEPENVALIGALIIFMLLIIAIIYNGLSYSNKSELERCMIDYKDYNYCKRYDNKGE